MALKIFAAEEADVDRIAEIHLAAFASNLMLLTQFPTPAVREGLRISLAKKALDEIRDPKWAVLVVRDGDKIISFAKWCLPFHESEGYEETPWQWPDGTNFEVLEKWSAVVDAASDRVIGSTPCYRLTFTATDPSEERRGAGSMLIQWGVERSKKENIPIVLESTLSAIPLYESHGFKSEENISLVLEDMGKDGKPVIYREKSLVFRPS